MTGLDADLATLREALAIAWPEGDHAEPHVFSEALVALDRVEAGLEREVVPYELVLLLEAAELEVQRLREERDTLTERDYWASQTIHEQERECVRLRRMLGVRPDIDPETGYGRVEAV